MYEHGSMLLKLFAPRGHDPQTAHTRDELYFVASGSGWFVNGGERHPISPGDALFVPAGVAHHFEDFSDDFAVWVVFYGPREARKRKALMPDSSLPGFWDSRYRDHVMPWDAGRVPADLRAFFASSKPARASSCRAADRRTRCTTWRKRLRRAAIDFSARP